MNYIILDVEATDAKSQPKEIIEIGAVKLDDQLNYIDSFQSIVQPKLNKELSWFIKKLTNISQEEIDNAQFFPDIFHQFSKWIGEDFVILTWGREDRKFFSRNIKLHEIESDITDHFINIQNKISSLLLSGTPIGLKNALQICNVYQDGQHHRALDDAHNTSKLFIEFFHQFGDLQKIKQNDIDEENLRAEKQISYGKFKGYKINYIEYKKHLLTLDESKLAKKLVMLENILQEELQKIVNNEATYLYVVANQKRNITRSFLANRMKELSLQEAGITLTNIEAPLKSINILYTIKERVIIKKNIKSNEFHMKIISKITRIRKALKKINNPINLNVDKNQIVEYHREILQLIRDLLQSPYFRVQYTKQIEEAKLKTLKSFHSIQRSIEKAV